MLESFGDLFLLQFVETLPAHLQKSFKKYMLIKKQKTKLIISIKHLPKINKSKPYFYFPKTKYENKVLISH
jgi:protein tyrosine phosphatase